MQKTILGYMDTCHSKTIKQLTAETLEQLLISEKVNKTMESIEQTTDEEAKKSLKEQLPVVLYACQMPQDGVRPKAETAVPSGFCLHDWDHMTENPRTFYFQNIAGRETEVGIILAHVTPRGQGLRLVTKMTPGENIIRCQERIAAMFGMQKFADKKVKDLSRISFLPSKSYMLYQDNEALFNTDAPEPSAITSSEGTERAKAVARQVVAEHIPSLSTHVMTSIAENFSYEGIKYSTIIEALLKRIATQGKPCEGERNDDLFILVRELRHICQYNFNTVHMLVAPYFPTLQDAEIRRTISNAIATTGRTITPVMRGVLAELRNEDIEGVDDEQGMELAKLPKLSEVEEMILAHYPKHLRSQVFMAMLPVWGVYGTHVRFDYLDGRENSLSFMTAVVGKSGSGKAFAAHLFEQMTKRFRIEDALERKKADEYLAMCNKASDDSEKPDDPRPRVRIYGDDITTSQFLEYLDNLKGEHGIQFTEEVARLQKAKRTIFGDNDDLYCKAFDNAVGGKESKSKMTRNIRIPIYLNTLFCGTPGAMHKFYNNPEGGLNNRILFAFMPKVRLKGFPRYDRFTDEEQKLFDEVSNRLWIMGKDHSKIELPWLERTILTIKKKWDKEDEENPDDVWYDLGKRSMVIAMRTGVLEWILRGCPTSKKEQQEISRVVRWIADAMRQSVYLFSGKDYEVINEKDNMLQEKQGCQTKNKKLFSLLADEFTTQDVIALRVQNGASTDVKMVIFRWMKHGLIRKLSNGHYRKIHGLAA